MNNKVKFEPKIEHEYDQRDHKEDLKNQRNNNNRRRGDRSRRGRSTSNAFRGEHKDLQGYVYEYDTNARPNQYDKTTSRIGQWVKQELDHSLDIWNAIANLEEPDMSSWDPAAPAEGDVVAKAKFEKKIELALKREEDYVKNRTAVYSIVYGQCSGAMKAQLDSQADWKTINKSHDLVPLMKSIKVWMLNQQSSKSPTMVVISASKSLFKMYQGQFEDLVDFRKRFVAAAEVIDHIDADLSKFTKGIANKIIKDDYNVERSSATSTQVKAAEKAAKNRFLAALFLDAADPYRYRVVLEDLEHSYIKGTDEYPADVTGAFNLLQNWNTKSKLAKTTPHNDGVNFAQGAEHGADQNDGARVDLCFRCGQPGHHARHCPKGKRGGAAGSANAMNGEQSGTDNKETVNAMTGGAGASMGVVGASYDDDEAYECAMCIADADPDDHPAVVGGEHNEYGAQECALSTGDSVASNSRTSRARSEAPESARTTKNAKTAAFDRPRAEILPPGSVGLDSMSTVDIFGDHRLLTDIRRTPSTMRIICNGGSMLITHKGKFGGYGEVWYHPQAIANILSLQNVQKRYRVTFDSANGNRFLVHRGDGTARVFSPSAKGLYASPVLGADNEVAMVSTVKENLRSFTRREVKRATEARRLLSIIGRPSEQQFRRILDDRLLRNCDIHGQDAKNAHSIFGPDVGSLRGKTVRRSEAHVELVQRPVPDEIWQRHREVTICFDVMYVNGIAFLVSVSRSIKFCTAEALQNRKAETLLIGLRRIKKVYAKRGFIVSQAAGDNEFHSLEVGLSEIGVALNVVSRDEHVPEIERYIRTLKERCRSTYNTMPFAKLPARMIVELVYAMTFWIHVFPAQDGVSHTMGPREIIYGVSIDAKKHCVIPFGAYAQTHEQHDNSMDSRTMGAIALRPTGNAQGGHFFYNLRTGKRISRNRWTELPMPDEVVKRVEQMSDSASVNRLTFGNRNNEDDDDNDVETHSIGSGPSSESGSTSGSRSDGEDGDEGAEVRDEDDVPDGMHGDDSARHDGEEAHGAQSPGDYEAHIEEAHGAQPPGIKQEEEELPQYHDDMGNGAANSAPPPAIEQEDDDWHTRDEGQYAENDNESIENAGVGENEDPEETARRALSEQMDAAYGARSGRHNLRTRREPTYKKKNKDWRELLAQASDGLIPPRFDSARLAARDASLEPLFNVLLTQYGVNKGLKLFGQKGDDAVKAEMVQLHLREVMTPKSGPALTEKNKRDALSYLMFLKEKRDGSIKGRGCADGRKQRGSLSKADISSPTISTEGLFLIVTIAAKEKRDVAIIDIPGAFLQTDLDEACVHIKLQGRMAELLAMIDPVLYRRHIIIERGRPVLYAELKKALYGMLQSALRFWQQVSADLDEMGFTPNPYDSCIANRMVNGKQQTIGWHVDDFVMTHEDPAVNDATITWFNNKYGSITPVTVHRGLVHEYLGMTLDFTQPGKVKILMVDYVQRMINEAPEPFGGNASTPAANHLFDIDDNSKALDEQHASRFHHMVAKALFLCKRARPDIQLTVGFLSTRVRAPTEEDWRKLKRLVQYLRGSAQLGLTLEADGGHVVKWWIDAAFAVHGDMRSQSGTAMSLGKGMVYSSTTKQKLNTRSSTEAELVAVNDFLPQVLWTRHFLSAQGYELHDNVVYQDNESSMLLANNGRASSGKRTRHINIRFFFVTDRIKKGEIRLQHCPTDKMIADFYTKPLQGTKFRQLRDIVLNVHG